ncbi:MAG: ribonuclease P protein component [Paracoccus sp. (in: a-proteobacteria)]|nr:ribonuclease P protein component [Paracoccus sp. (in: a-proteobacteria)]
MPPVSPQSADDQPDAPEGAVFRVSAPVETLRVRADFLRASKALRQGMPGFLLQARRRDGDEAGTAVRVGFTCSKKLGNAVTRNRAKRRLREIARATLPDLGRPGWDYVLVGRPEATISHDFSQMRADLEAALRRIHKVRG